MIQAYCLHRSYTSQDEVELCVSTTSPTFSLNILRMGREPTECLQITDIEGAHQPVPQDVVANGCGWQVSVRFRPDSSWRSGFYKIDLTSSDGATSEAFFILRAVSPTSPILWVVETNTWNAYNFFGGASTYTKDGEAYAGGAPRVSFERPLPAGFISLPEERLRFANPGPPITDLPYTAWAEANGTTFWSGAASWGHWGAAFASWLDDEGIEVDFAANEDIHHDPALLDRYRLMLSVGHDEYWTWEMRDAVEGFAARGGNVAFFSGNTAFWQVRIEDGGRQMVAYKAAVSEDPVMGTADERHNSGMWSHAATKRPENSMTGVSFTRGGYARFAKATPASAGGYTIYHHEHWALEGTGLGYGDQLGDAQALVGYEVDGCVFQFKRGRPYPTGEDGTPSNFEIIGIAPAALFTHSTAPDGLYTPESTSDLQLVALQVAGSQDADALDQFARGHAVMGSYVVPGGGTVFTGGTTEWAYGLKDPQVAQITRNIINRLS